VPTYQYACTACDERLEVVQKFTDETLTDCPVCHGRLRKVFSPVGVLFKGSGFYRTDSRSNGAKEKTTEPAKTGASDSSAPSSSSSDSSPAKPAAKSATTKSESAA